MANYTRILTAVDLSEDSDEVVERARAIATNNGAELHLIHVIEPLSFAYGGDIPMDLSTVQDQIHEQAKSHLAEFSAKLDVPPSRQHLIFGRPESEIQRTAEAVGADVIIVGSHGRHGLALGQRQCSSGGLWLCSLGPGGRGDPGMQMS